MQLVVAHPHHSGPRQAITRHVFMPSPPLGPSITLWPLAGPVWVHGGHTAIRCAISVLWGGGEAGGLLVPLLPCALRLFRRSSKPAEIFARRSELP